MKYKAMKFFAFIAFLLMPSALFAQQRSPLDDPQQLKQFYESIEKTVDQYTSSLKLETWQVFKIDSTLSHDYMEMMKEMESLNKARVANVDLFQKTQDKWNEQIYNSFRGILDDAQWQKFLKSGAAMEKKARDKREAKRGKQIESK